MRQHAKRCRGEIEMQTCSVEDCNDSFEVGKRHEHHKRKHAKIKDHKCQFCSSAFVTVQELNRHIAAVHTDDRPFMCQRDGCEKRFVTSGKLHAHDDAHKGKKNHACPVENCSSAFGQAGHLKGHLDTVHNKLRPFKCAECGDAFGRIDTLRNHEILHTGEKPHRCDIDDCKATFAQRAGLNNHMLKKHTAQFIARRKVEEEKVAAHLRSIGLVELTSLGDALPPAGHFKREHRVYFSCAAASASERKYACIDFIVGAINGGHVFLEVDEKQHRFGYGSALSCDFKRMYDVMAAAALDASCREGAAPGLRVQWLRYNPHSWYVDGSLVRVGTADRLKWLGERLQSAAPSSALTLDVEYAFYDEDEGELGVVADEDFPSELAERVIIGTTPEAFGRGLECLVCE